MDYLLETSIVSSLFKNDQAITGRITALGDDDVLYTSVITEGELLFGASKVQGSRSQQFSVQIGEFLDSLRDVIPITRGVASAYAMIRRDLNTRGQMIPVSGLWIAATAMEGGFTLVARDEHFERVRGLAIEDWSRPA